MSRPPRGKRSATTAGSFEVVAKNSNGAGSVYFQPAFVEKDGRERKGVWRATYRDADGRVHRVSAPTRAKAEAKRDEVVAQLALPRSSDSRFTRQTTVAELTSWWLDSVARHQVRTSTLDSYRKFAGYMAADLGALPVVSIGPETLTRWQSSLLDKYAPYTVLNCRKVCRQAFMEAVKVGLIATNPFDLVKAPRAKRVKAGRALSPEDARSLISAAQSLRYGAAVTLLFCQGWRVSEVLGLAWDDLDLEAGTAHIRRGAAYTPSLGTILGATKTSGAEGIHYLAPVAVAHLRRRLFEQQADIAKLGAAWPSHTYEGERLSMVFTTARGDLVNRQAITQELTRAAELAGLDPAGLATHSGRRTVVTALYAAGGLDLADVARHVGHSDPSTTAEYVRSLGHRPIDTARRAAELLDPTVA